MPKAQRRGLHLLVAPETILRWHRDIVRRRWAARSMHGQTGRPATRRNIRALILRLARENPNGGPQDPRRAGRPGREGSGIDSVGNPEEGRNRPRAAPIRACLVAVPALPGRRDPGMRLLHGQPARWYPGLCPGRDRARHQANPHPGSHRASHWEMDRPAGPQPDHGPRRPGAPGQVHDPRLRPGLHGRIRRGPRRCRDPDRAL